MVDDRIIYRKKRLLLGISIIVVLISSSYIPVVGGARISQENEENIILNVTPSPSEGDEIVGEQAEQLGIGIFWWMHGDPTLANTREDTRGFQNYLVSKGFRKDFDINEDEFTKYKLTDGALGQDQDYLEQTDFVYYAGHGGKKAIATHPDFNIFTLALYYECSWGDEGPVKWVGLASCENTYNHFKYSMNGVHMILGWSSWCDDKQFGEALAKHCIDDEMSIKESWFETSIEKSTTRNLEAKILGENSEVGDDSIYSGGQIADSPAVTNMITYWKCPVNHFPNIYSDPIEGETVLEGTSQDLGLNELESEGTETMGSTGGSTPMVRGDLTSLAGVDSSPTSDSDEDLYLSTPNYEEDNIYYIETDDKSIVFPTIVVSEQDVYTADEPNLEYEKANWQAVAKKYMLDKGLLEDSDEQDVNYFMKMVPQKQGFSYKKTSFGLLDENEYFKEWDIALNIFVIKKLDGDVLIPVNIGNEDNSEETSTNSNLKTGDVTIESEESNLPTNIYQKTTIVLSQGSKIGYSLTRFGEYNEDEWDKTGGDDEP